MGQMLDELKHAVFLKDLNEEQLALLDPLMEPILIPAGTVILEQGGAARYLYIIQHGSVVIRYKPYDGPAITLTHLGEGDVFGWSAVIGNRTYASTILSETELEAIRIRGGSLRQLCLAHSEMGKIILDRLAQAVSSRWRNARHQVREMLDRKLAK